MTSKKLKQLLPLIPKTDDELAALIGRAEGAQLNKETAIALRDAKIAEAKKGIEANYGFDLQIASCELEEENCKALLEAWAMQNESRFGKKKSLEIFGLCFGWRSNGWATATVGKTTWKEVVERLQQMSKHGLESIRETAKSFLRVKIEPNKEAMLAAREDPELTAFLFVQGVAFEEDEKFFAKFQREGQGGTELV
jgi:hypothetical protein